MKKILALILTVLMICSVAFAVDPQHVYIQGNVPDGYINPGNEDDIDDGENPVADDGKIKVYARVVTDSNATPSTANLSWSNATDLNTFSSSDSYKTVNLFHEEDDVKNTNDIESLVIIYAVIGNLSENAQPAASVTVSHDGWVLEGESSFSNDLTLSLSSVEKGMTGEGVLLKGDVTNNSTFSNTISVQRVDGNTTEGAITKATLIGYTTVTWGVYGNATPAAGDYKAIITIGVDSEG